MTEPAKPQTITIRVIRVHKGPQSPHSTVFEAAVCNSETKKRKKIQVVKIIGYLPSFSPAIEYRITTQEEEDKTEKGGKVTRIVKIHNWKRLCWWLTEDYIGPALEPFWGQDKAQYVAGAFERAISTEKDLKIWENVPYAELMFRHHFAPNAFFDFATLTHTENKNRNMYSSYVLEKNYDSIAAWQKLLDSNLVSGTLRMPIQMPGLSWEHMEQLFNLARERIKQGFLTEEDRQHEKKLKEEAAKTSKIDNLVGEPPKDCLGHLVYPPIPSHDYHPIPPTYSYIYKFVQTLQSRLKNYGETSFTFHAPNAEVRELIKRYDILYEIGENQWTLPKHVINSSIINNILGNFYKKPEDVLQPATLEEALNLPACLITTQGHNVFEIYRRLAGKAEENKIEFICPNPETARLFHIETDHIPQPLGTSVFGRKILVICFSNQFSFKNLALSLQRWNGDTLPEKIFLFGDPDLMGVRGVGCPFVELLEAGRLPVFRVSWESPESQIFYSDPIRDFLGALGSATLARSIPWSDGLQICDPENMKQLYNDLLATPNVDDYHILCDSFQDLRKHEKLVRAKYPNGLSRGDKIWIAEKKSTDWIEITKPISDGKTGMDKPANLVLVNRANHLVRLHNDRSSNHADCCESSPFSWECKPSKHPMIWSTIQTFRDNRLPLRKHIVVILTDFTCKKHLYSAACMAKYKLTIVGTMGQVEKALKRTPVSKKPASLLEYTVDPTKRVLE